MQEALASHDLRGLRLIADLCILQGIIHIGTSILVLMAGFLMAIIILGAGIILIAMGYYLDKLHPVAWWVVVISKEQQVLADSTRLHKVNRIDQV